MSEPMICRCPRREPLGLRTGLDTACPEHGYITPAANGGGSTEEEAEADD